MANEKRLIDANAIKYYDHAECYGAGIYRNRPIAYKDDIDEMPTVDAIEKLQAMNNELEYALAGVMHSVDKWLEADDFDHDEVQRAAIMREKTLRIVERLQAELKQTKRERDAAVADINCGCICVVCKHEKHCKMAQNPLCDEEEPCRFEWRGVQED